MCSALEYTLNINCWFVCVLKKKKEREKRKYTTELLLVTYSHMRSLTGDWYNHGNRFLSCPSVDRTLILVYLKEELRTACVILWRLICSYDISLFKCLALNTDRPTAFLVQEKTKKYRDQVNHVMLCMVARKCLWRKSFQLQTHSTEINLIICQTKKQTNKQTTCETNHHIALLKDCNFKQGYLKK